VTPDQLARLPAALFEIGKLIGSDLDPGQLLSRISELVCTLIECDACSVMLLDAGRQRLMARAAYGLRTERVHKLSFKVGEGVAGWVAERGEPAVIDDVRTDPRFVVLDEAKTPIISMLCVPLVSRGERVGVITATSGKPAAFRTHDLDLLRFVAATIALDIENVRLHRVAVTDPLTGAYNREFLATRLPQEIAAAHDREAPLSIAMIDCDHFKAINDRHGHDAGDEVLAEVARRLRNAIRGGDLLVRYGGEEFLTVLPRADAGKAWEVGERMRLRVSEEPIEIAAAREPIGVHVSIGIAQLREGGKDGAASETPAELIRRADLALYAAKARGRDRVEVAP
jgi:diguanylate cyclase (GGDEF)-like protein